MAHHVCCTAGTAKSIMCSSAFHVLCWCVFFTLRSVASNEKNRATGSAIGTDMLLNKKKIYVGTRRKKEVEVFPMTRKTSMDSTVGNRKALREISVKSFTMEVFLVYSLYLMNLFSFDIGSYCFSYYFSIFSVLFNRDRPSVVYLKCMSSTQTWLLLYFPPFLLFLLAPFTPAVC